MGFRSTESGVLAACLQYLSLRRVFHYRHNQTPVPLPGGGYRRFVGMRGIADIIAVIPRTCEVLGHGKVTVAVYCAIEVKRPGEKPRQEQREFLRRIEELGGIALCVHSVQELQEQLEPFLAPTSIIRKPA
jgi:hypothetical protein